jgi:peptidoglycan/xylan/chitin deacetylase (PgdA/CDA1 family)
MQPRLALTFDDGPDERSTPAVLSALARHGVQATFFMIGERAVASASLAAAVLAAGHEVQLHCHRHVRHTQLSEAQIESDAVDGLSALRAIGADPVAWRTPWGVRTAATEAVAARLGLTVVGWEHDSHDWRGDGAAQVLRDIGPRLADGGSVLMHDGLGPGSRRTTAVNTVELIDAIADLAARGGLAMGPLSCEDPSLVAGARELTSTAT